MYDLWARSEALREAIMRMDSDKAQQMQWRWEDATGAEMYVPWSRPRWEANVLQRLDWAIKDCTCECGKRIPRWNLCKDCEPVVAARHHAEHVRHLQEEVESLRRQLEYAQDRLARAQEESR